MMSSMRSFLLLLLGFTFLSGVAHSATLTPTPTEKNDDATPVLEKRTDPTFPPQPTSCPRCERDYPAITHCSQAIPLFANFSQVIYNPKGFLDVIQCSCTETFQAVFPQCVDCFQQTGQLDVLQTNGQQNLPDLVKGMRSICSVASTILGNVTVDNGEQVGGTPSPIPSSASRPIYSRAPIIQLGIGIILAATGVMIL